MKIYIRLADAIGPTVARAFDDLTVRTETVLTGDVADDAALHGLIARCRDLGIPMLDLRVEGREAGFASSSHSDGARIPDAPADGEAR